MNPTAQILDMLDEMYSLEESKRFIYARIGDEVCGEMINITSTWLLHMLHIC